MIYDHKVIQDGQTYLAGEEVPDIGSWVDISENGEKDYRGLSKDVSKLPKGYPNTGSTAYCVDNGDLYMFEKTSNKWYLQ